MGQERALEDKKAKVRRPEPKEVDKYHAGGAAKDTTGLINLQHQVGNRAVQRLLAQRNGDGGFELDDETAGRINQARGSGQALDSAVQKQMNETMGHDFSGVRVHTSPEADDLNQQLRAKAFTTGQDIFFRQGVYEPNSSSGRELIAHELTHVVQQSSGAVGGSGDRMTVNPPGDSFEQEADAVARQAAMGTETSAEAGLQRQEALEEEEPEVQMKAIQRQEALEEEEPEVQMKAIQRQEAMEEEEPEVQMKAVQRQDELSEEPV